MPMRTTGTFLECQHICQHSAYQQLQQEIQLLHQQHNIDPHMLHLLWQGLHSVHQQYTVTNQLKTYPSQFQTLFIDQSHIGWEQLYYGCTAITWAAYIDYSRQYKTNGTIFYSQIITKIWKYNLATWAIQNATLHPSNPMQQTIQSLAPQVHQLYQFIANKPTLFSHEPNTSAEKLLQQPIWTIRNFLTTRY